MDYGEIQSLKIGESFVGRLEIGRTPITLVKWHNSAFMKLEIWHYSWGMALEHFLYQLIEKRECRHQ